MLRSSDEIYQIVKKVFEQKNVLIQEITSRMMKLTITIYGLIQGAPKKFEIYLQSQKNINGYIINDLFSRSIKLEENIALMNEKNKKLIEENIKIKEENIKIKTDILKLKNDVLQFQVQNKANENHINLLIAGIDKINNFIDSRETNQNSEPES